MNIVEQTIESLGHGGATRMARACRVKPQNITRWKRTGKVPAQHCPAVEQLTGGRVRAEQLRPDVGFQRDAHGRVTGYYVFTEAKAA